MWNPSHRAVVSDMMAWYTAGMIRRVLAIACVGAAFGIGVWVLRPKVVVPRAPEPTPPAVQLKGIALAEFAEGTKIWELKADAVVYDQDAQRARLKTIEVRFWEAGQVVSVARSPEAELHTDSRDLRLQGGISVDSLLATTSVEAERVAWNAATQELLAEGGVRFRRGKSLLEGPRLRANRSLMKVWMDEPVRARLMFEEGKL